MNKKKNSQIYKSAFIDYEKGWNHFAVNKDEFAFKIIGNKLVIVFDGTDGFKEWWSNFKIKKIKAVHKGFLMTAKNMSPFIFSIVERYKKMDIKIISYSRGIYSLIIACDIKNKYQNQNIEIINFGSPKIGNLFSYADKKSIEKMQITNIVNRGDLITLLPPYLLGYKTKNPGEYIYNGSKANWIFPRISKHFEYFE